MFLSLHPLFETIAPATARSLLLFILRESLPSALPQITLKKYLKIWLFDRKIVYFSIKHLIEQHNLICAKFEGGLFGCHTPIYHYPFLGNV